MGTWIRIGGWHRRWIRGWSRTGRATTAAARNEVPAAVNQGDNRKHDFSNELHESTATWPEVAAGAFIPVVDVRVSRRRFMSVRGIIPRVLAGIRPPF